MPTAGQQRRHVPAGHLAMGIGAKVVKELPEDFWEQEPLAASKYRRLAESYLRGIEWTWPDSDWDERDAAACASRSDAGRTQPGGS